jgi:MoaA/NifB/PqqE/SkfB family radical SAM enzyme
MCGVGFLIKRKHMDEIQIANILLTRRCNLRCDYCSIVRDYSDKPEIYPDMSHYQNNELEPDQWISILSRLKNNNPNVFIIFYGGEPFLYADLPKLISHCHKEDIAYTVISNNTPAVQQKIIDLYDEVGMIRGFTASIDPILAKHKDVLNDSDIEHSVLKTVEGYQNLKRLKDSGMVGDVVAEITITPANARWLYETVEMLSKVGIYSSITAIDLKKSPYYDFSTIDDEFCQIPQNDRMASQFFRIMANKDLKVHIPELLLDLYNALPSNMMCKIHEDVHNVTIDADGTFRLCLRIRGQYVPSLKNQNVLNSDGRIEPFFKTALKKDYDDYCKGCNWTCMLMSGKFSNNIQYH